jgi:hypothetical protein
MTFSSETWTAVIGLAGIGGTLLAAHLANASAERRQRNDQEHEDRTRFHKERVEIYARFLRASRMCRDAALKSAPFVVQNYGGAIPESEQAAILERFRNAWAELTEASEIVSLVASLQVNEVADTVTELARAIVVLDRDWTFERLNSRNAELAEFESRFRAAAREELLLERRTEERTH